MMAYNNEFVVAVKVNGKVQRENNKREVFIPFDTEYSLLLKNLTNTGATAEILIDGTNVLGVDHMFVPENSTVELSRFCLNGDMYQGNKFKFVSVSNKLVQDPSNKENGVITVNFRKQIRKPSIIRGFTPIGKTHYGMGDWTIGSGCFYSSTECSTTTSSHNVPFGAQFKSYMAEPVVEPAVGATIEGSVSNQFFSRINAEFSEDIAATVTIRLKGAKTAEASAVKWCQWCRHQVKDNFVYCPGCGKPLKF